MIDYETIVERVKDITNEENNIEDRVAKTLAFQNELAEGQRELDELHARVDELTEDCKLKDARIDNLLKRNEELRFAVGEQYKNRVEETTEEIIEEPIEETIKKYF